MALPPIVRGASTALYPFQQTLVHQTGISGSQAAPARCVKGPPQARFEFPCDPAKNSLQSC